MINKVLWNNLSFIYQIFLAKNRERRLRFKFLFYEIHEAAKI